mgnify:CR=1 FL=1
MLSFLAFFFKKKGVMRCGAAETTGLDFFCFVVINPRVVSQQS